MLGTCLMGWVSLASEKVPTGNGNKHPFLWASPFCELTYVILIAVR